MRGKLALLIFNFLVLSGLCAQNLISIETARSLSIGSKVNVIGIINCPDFGFTNGQYYVQDETGGINIFHRNVGGETGTSVDYDVADTVQIKGSIEVFNGLIEILPDEVILLGKGSVLPTPIQISPSDLVFNSPYDGMLVELPNVRLRRATQWPATPIRDGNAVNVDGLAGESAIPFIIRIDRGQSFFDGAPIPDDPFTLRGVLSRFGDDIQIYPFFESDLIQTTTTSTFETLKLNNTLKIYPNPVTEHINLEILPKAGEVSSAYLFDNLGRQIFAFEQINARNQIIQLSLPQNIVDGQYYLMVRTENGVKTSKVNIRKR